jgi:flagellar hook-basal body complex protein FliE
MIPASAIQRVASEAASSTSSAATPTANEGSSFADTLKALVDQAEGASGEANTAITGMVDKSVDVHDAMIALQRAEMSLQLAVQVRNKLVQAYQDIMRMPV